MNTAASIDVVCYICARQPSHRASWTTQVRYSQSSAVTSSYRASHVAHRCRPSRGIATGMTYIGAVSDC